MRRKSIGIGIAWIWLITGCGRDSQTTSASIPLQRANVPPVQSGHVQPSDAAMDQPLPVNADPADVHPSIAKANAAVPVVWKDRIEFVAQKIGNHNAVIVAAPKGWVIDHVLHSI